MSRRKVKNIYKSKRMAQIFLSVCFGNQELGEIAGHLKFKHKQSLQHYLDQLLKGRMIKRKIKDPNRKDKKTGKPKKSSANPWLYSPNFRAFTSLTVLNGEILHSASGWTSIPYAKILLPALAKHYFGGKSRFLKKINLLEIKKVIDSEVVHYLTWYKERKTQEEEALLQTKMAGFLHPETTLLNVDSILNIKSKKTRSDKKPKFQLDEKTLFELASELELE